MDAGAEMLALKLDQWWHSRGYTQVRHWIEVAPVTEQLILSFIAERVLDLPKSY